MITMEKRLGALRSKLLESMHHMPDDPTEEELNKLNRSWKYLRGQITKVGNEIAHAGGEIGESDRFRDFIFQAPQWRRFADARKKWNKRRPAYIDRRGREVPSYLDRQKEYARGRRADPDTNEAINARRRERYAQKKASKVADQETDSILSTI